jgi:DNA-binding transcriptional regulator YiaG
MGLSLGSIGSLAGAYFGGPVGAIAGGMLGSAIDGNPSIVGGGGGSSSAGSVTLPVQDRSGVSSGTANYTPEYYQAIQQKYNQYMPQQQGKDISADLKNWYETKYSPAATQSPSAFTQAQINQPTNINNYIAQQKTINPQAFTTSEQYAAAMDKYGVTPASLAKALNIPEWQVQLEYNRVDPSGKYAASANNLIQQVVTGMQQSGKSNADIAALMDQYKTTPSQVASALNMSAQDVQNLYNTADPKGLFSTVPTTTTAAAQTTQPATPTYTPPSLSSASTPAEIAQAYSNFINSSGAYGGGDTAANREAAINYLSNLGVSNDTIGQAYGLFKGA